MKKCRVCKHEKNLLSFSKDKRAKDGYQTECRQCRADRYARNKAVVEPIKYVSQDDVKWYKNIEVYVLIFSLSYLSYMLIKGF